MALERAGRDNATCLLLKLAHSVSRTDGFTMTIQCQPSRRSNMHAAHATMKQMPPNGLSRGRRALLKWQREAANDVRQPKPVLRGAWHVY